MKKVFVCSKIRFDKKFGDVLGAEFVYLKDTHPVLYQMVVDIDKNTRQFHIHKLARSIAYKIEMEGCDHFFCDGDFTLAYWANSVTHDLKAKCIQVIKDKSEYPKHWRYIFSTAAVLD